jgi:hypothetical protein
MLKVNAGYIHYAHGVETSDASLRIAEAAVGKDERQMVTIDDSDDAIRRELISVAELYDHPEVEERKHAATARRILRKLS